MHSFNLVCSLVCYFFLFVFVSLFHILVVSFVVLPFTNKYIYNFNSIFNHILFFLPSSLFSDKIYCQHIVILCCCIILFVFVPLFFLCCLCLYILLLYYDILKPCFQHIIYLCAWFDSIFLFYFLCHFAWTSSLCYYQLWYVFFKIKKNAKLCCCCFFVVYFLCSSNDVVQYSSFFPLQLFVFYVFQLIDTTSSQYSVVFMRICSSF